MEEIRWELYPLVAASERSRSWLQIQCHLQLAPKTIDAYGRSLNDFLAFCQRSEIVPETITREQVALYVQDLAHRPNPKGAKLLSIESGRGLSNATMQQRITVLRLYCDSLIERQLRQDNPVGRGHRIALQISRNTVDLTSGARWSGIITTMTTPTPSFLDAYLVALDSFSSPPIGVVRKDRTVWRIYLFGVAMSEQPREAFATRAEAGQRAVELASI